MKQPFNIPPAQLWLGSHDHLVSSVEQYLQTIFCCTPNLGFVGDPSETSTNKSADRQGCNTCSACEKVRQRQHHAISWFYPEKQYSVEQLAPIADLISLELNPDDHYFIIIQKADLLTQACGNRLLKSIEEPPAGYHFMLLAQQRENILPTIRSRCTIQTFSSTDYEQQSHNSLFRFFTQAHNSPAEFLKELELSKINEQETVELVDEIFAYWLKQYKKQIIEPLDDKTTIEIALNHLRHSFEMPPMAGSSKIFLKDLYLRINS